MYSLALPVCISLTTAHGDPAAELMVEARHSSSNAFVTLVHRNRQPLLNFFSRQGARNDCEDLVQETFIRLFRYRDRYQPTTKFSAFLYTIARHAWADHCRKTLRWQRFFSSYEQESAIAERACQQESSRGYDVEAALSSLSPKLREVIDLHFYQGLRQQEVAARLGVPLGTVKSRVNLAMRKLRDRHDTDEVTDPYANSRFQYEDRF